MQIDHVFKGIEAGEEIKAFLNDKTEKLKRFFQGKLHAKWLLQREKDSYTAHLHVLGNQIDYFSESSAENLMSAIEQAVERLERQLNKHKEITKDHHKS